MVARPLSSIIGAILAGSTLPLAADTPREAMFPGDRSCYARAYSADHLARHPDQQATSIALTPEAGMAGDPLLQVWVTATVRDWPGEALTALAYCEAAGTALSCGLEGDAGSFSLAPDREGTVLLTVARGGMGFEGARGFVTFAPNRGDDRSFRLRPTRDCR